MKQQKRKRRRFTIIALFALLLTMLPGAVSAEAPPAEGPTTGVILSPDMSDKGVLTRSFDLNQPSAKAEYIQALQKLRGELYDQNVPFDGKTLQKAATEAGFATKEAYVNGFVWDQAMERIALQRLFESVVHKQVAHMRVTSDDVWTATYQGQGANSEILAWGTNAYDSVYSGWGYGELDALKAANGFANGANGHLHSLIDPTLHYHGFAITSAGLYGRTAVGQAAHWVSNPNAADTGYVGSFDGGVAVPLSAATKEVKEEKEEIAPPEDVIEETTDLFEGEEEILQAGAPGECVMEKTVYRYAYEGTEYIVREDRTESYTTKEAAATRKRVGIAKKVVETEDIPFAVERRADETLFAIDGDQVLQAGVPGKRETVYKEYVKDGETIREKISEGVVQEPVPQIIGYGLSNTIRQTRTEAIPFSTEYREDAGLYIGEEKISVRGVDGERTIIEKVTKGSDGTLTRNEVSRMITRQPVAQIVLRGTKEKPKVGWVEKDGRRYYITEQGTMFYNRIITFGNDWYYMGSDGSAQTGILEIRGELYYADETGLLQRSAGWINYKDNRYFAQEGGVLFRNRIITFGPKVAYVMGRDGRVMEGMVSSQGTMYYANPLRGGNIRGNAGWVEKDGHRYYITDQGTLFYNRIITFGSKVVYVMGKDGYVMEGIVNSGGNLYFANPARQGNICGNQGWQDYEGKRYYIMPDDTVRRGWLSFGDTYYYCQADGSIARNTKLTIDGRVYEFDENGVRHANIGWVLRDGKWYYYTEEGQLFYNRIITFGPNHWYVMGSEGQVLTGLIRYRDKMYFADPEARGNIHSRLQWIDFGGERYYAMPDYTLRQGWLSFGTTYYYCKPYGNIVRGEILRLDKGLCTFDAEGVLRQVDGHEAVVYRTENGEKFHRQTCPSIQGSGKTSRPLMYWEVERNFGACKVCKP